MESITVQGRHDPAMTGTLQDDPLPAAPGHPGFWHVEGGWKSPEEVGQELIAQLPPGVAVPQLLFDARDVTGYAIIMRRSDSLTLTTLEEQVLPGPAPVLTSLSSTSAVIGGPDVRLRVEGTGLSRGAVILFNGGEEHTDVVVLETTIAMASATTPGTYPVTVRNPDGQESAPLDFEIQAPSSRRRRSSEEG